jgi:TolB-like protein
LDFCFLESRADLLRPLLQNFEPISMKRQNRDNTFSARGGNEMKRWHFLFILAIVFSLGGCANIATHANLSRDQERYVQSVPDNEMDKQIDNLTQQIVASLTTQKTSKIAVIEFPDVEGQTTVFGKYLAEELITRLFRTGRFQVIERQLLNKIMEEQKLSAMGLFDPKTVKEFGRILGVDAITTGTITDLDMAVKINARLIATETGSVFAVASVRIPLSRELETLLGKKSGERSKGRVSSFQVLANAYWQNTVSLQNGQTITVIASGGWNHGEQRYGNYGPDGCGKMDGGVILPSASVGTLIGRIGNQRPFVIGSKATFTANADGVLQLSMNDWGFENNYGSAKVQIEVK